MESQTQVNKYLLLLISHTRLSLLGVSVLKSGTSFQQNDVESYLRVIKVWLKYFEKVHFWEKFKSCFFSVLQQIFLIFHYLLICVCLLLKCLITCNLQSPTLWSTFFTYCFCLEEHHYDAEQWFYVLKSYCFQIIWRNFNLSPVTF